MTTGLLSRQKALKAYRALHFASSEERGVREASLIIQMLLDGLAASLATATLALRTGNPELFRQSVSRASHIVSGLTISLNAKAYPSLAEELLSVYRYIANRLDRLSLFSDEEELSDLLVMVGVLEKAWVQPPTEAYSG
jgi:flagellar biosynthetic protein FliS